MRLALLPRLLAPALAAGCVSVRTQENLFLSTDPEGAAILVEGKDTGFATPTWIPLGVGGAPTVTLRKRGFREESFTVGSGATWVGIELEASQSVRFLSLPLYFYFTAPDVMFPIRVRTRRTPNRVHLKLLPL